MMQEIGFFKAFVELFNVNAAFIIIVLCGHVLLKMYRLDRSLLKARLFLNSTILQQIWTSISVAGVAFAVNALLKLVGLNMTIKDVIHDFYLIELTEVVFIITFMYAVFYWYIFINTPHQQAASN